MLLRTETSSRNLLTSRFKVRLSRIFTANSLPPPWETALISEDEEDEGEVGGCNEVASLTTAEKPEPKMISSWMR